MQCTLAATRRCTATAGCSCVSDGHTHTSVRGAPARARSAFSRSCDCCCFERTPPYRINTSTKLVYVAATQCALVCYSKTLSTSSVVLAAVAAVADDVVPPYALCWCMSVRGRDGVQHQYEHSHQHKYRRCGYCAEHRAAKPHLLAHKRALSCRAAAKTVGSRHRRAVHPWLVRVTAAPRRAQISVRGSLRRARVVIVAEGCSAYQFLAP